MEWYIKPQTRGEKPFFFSHNRNMQQQAEETDVECVLDVFPEDLGTALWSLLLLSAHYNPAGTSTPVGFIYLQTQRLAAWKGKRAVKCHCEQHFPLLFTAAYYVNTSHVLLILPELCAHQTAIFNSKKLRAVCREGHAPRSTKSTDVTLQLSVALL